MAVRSPHHCDVDSDIVEPDDAVRPTSLDCRLVLPFQTKFDEERDGSVKVVDDDADVVHPLDSHVLKRKTATVPTPAQRSWARAGRRGCTERDNKGQTVSLDG